MNCRATGLGSDQSASADAYVRARNAIKRRMSRYRHLDRQIFGEPSWDVLLHLFVHEQDGTAIHHTELADLVGVSQQTMSRWMSILVNERLVEFVGNATANDPVYVISDSGRLLMLELFAD